MLTKSQRLVELDFFRGLVLLIIVVDHIGGSMLSCFTLHAVALNDATEVFVFLGGFSQPRPRILPCPSAAPKAPRGRASSSAHSRFIARFWSRSR